MKCGTLLLLCGATVAFDIAKLMVKDNADDGDASVDGVEFQWEAVRACSRVDDTTLRFAYNTADGDEEAETISIVSADSAFMEECVSRIMLERGWLRMVTSGGGPSDSERAMQRVVRHHALNFFQKKAK